MSNKAWYKNRLNDHYLKKSRQDNYRSRAVYKLEEIDNKYKILKKGMSVLDLGAAPGSWSQYVVNKLSGHAKIIAIDLLPIEPIKNVFVIEGDIRDKENQNTIVSKANGKVDVILSDMAPDTTGVHFADTENSFFLVNLALDIAEKLLKPGGHFVAKVFEGSEYKSLLTRAKQMFTFAKSFHPKASLSRSREIFLVAQNYKKNENT